MAWNWAVCFMVVPLKKAFKKDWMCEVLSSKEWKVAVGNNTDGDKNETNIINKK